MKAGDIVQADRLEFRYGSRCGFLLNVWRGCASLALLVIALICAATPKVAAETLESALAEAYNNNPQLNAQRAAARVTDENVPQALSGYRPRVGVTASVGREVGSITEQSALANGNTVATIASQAFTPATYGLTASQILFDGLQTANRTRTAESQVLAAREGLRVIEQNVLLSAATIYMDVLRDSGNVQIQQSNVATLKQLLEQTRKRFSRQDVTATDVHEAEQQLAAGEVTLIGAEATLATAKATYEAVIGVAPRNLKPASPVDRFVPKTLDAAIQVAVRENPNVTAAMYGVDVAYLQVKINEGALFPTLAAQAIVQQASQPQVLVTNTFTAGVIGQLSVPIYQGGAEYSLIRQSKETVAQQRLNLALAVTQVRALVAQAWAQLEAAKRQVQKAQEEVKAAEAAVDGLRKELLVGERTTLDLLIVQQNLVSARTSLISAQHDRVVASYNLLADIGHLSPSVMGLPTQIYDPQVHYLQVRDAWIGVRTPDGQ